MWPDREIRFSPADPAVHLVRADWKRMEQVLLKVLGRWVLQMGSSLSPSARLAELQKYGVQRLFYDSDFHCGVVELKPEADPEVFRAHILPVADLHIRMKASFIRESGLPIISAFTPSVYKTWEDSEYKGLLQMFNPILQEQPFEVHNIVKQEVGDIFYFQTTEAVVNYVKEKKYTLEHLLGQTIFNKKIETTMVDFCLTAPPPETLDTSGDRRPPPSPRRDDGPGAVGDPAAGSGPVAPGGPGLGGTPVDDPIADHEKWLDEQERELGFHGPRKTLPRARDDDEIEDGELNLAYPDNVVG